MLLYWGSVLLHTHADEIAASAFNAFKDAIGSNVSWLATTELRALGGGQFAANISFGFLGFSLSEECHLFVSSVLEAVRVPFR
jgi:hypothetical protein